METKFRAWDNVSQRWVTDDIVIDAYGKMTWKPSHSVGYEDVQRPQGAPIVITWFTGLKDKNGVEIYGKDTMFNPYDLTKYHEVMWSRHRGQWVLGDEDSPLWRYAPNEFWEVISEYPELTNEKADS